MNCPSGQVLPRYSTSFAEMLATRLTPGLESPRGNGKLCGPGSCGERSQPLAVPLRAGKSTRLYSLQKSFPFTPDLLCALGALCGEASSEFTTEGTQDTEIPVASRCRVRSGFPMGRCYRIRASPLYLASADQCAGAAIRGRDGAQSAEGRKTVSFRPRSHIPRVLRFLFSLHIFFAHPDAASLQV